MFIDQVVLLSNILLDLEELERTPAARQQLPRSVPDGLGRLRLALTRIASSELRAFPIKMSTVRPDGTVDYGTVDYCIVTGKLWGYVRRKYEALVDKPPVAP